MAYDERNTEHSGVVSGDDDPADHTLQFPAIDQDATTVIPATAPAPDPAPSSGDGIPGGADREEVDAERKRRLDPANRPAQSEVDNTHTHLPTVEAWDKLHPTEGTGGTADPSRTFREHPPSDDEVAAIEEERKRRLDPANRPPNSEVDNTGREFRDGHFVD